MWMKLEVISCNFIKQHVAEVTFVVNIFKYANVFVMTVFLYYILGDFNEIFKLASSNSN